MKAKRTLQIDVTGPAEDQPNVMRCILSVDGRDVEFFMHRANYEALMFDKVFLRNGLTEDSAGVINTTNTFIEEIVKLGPGKISFGDIYYARVMREVLEVYQTMDRISFIETPSAFTIDFEITVLKENPDGELPVIFCMGKDFGEIITVKDNN